MTPDPPNEYALPDNPTSKLKAIDIGKLLLERQRARDQAALDYGLTRQRRSPASR